MISLRINSSAKIIAGITCSSASQSISKGKARAGCALSAAFGLRFFDDCNVEFSFFDIARDVDILETRKMRLKNVFEHFVVLRQNRLHFKFLTFDFDDRQLLGHDSSVVFALGVYSRSLFRCVLFHSF